MYVPAVFAFLVSLRYLDTTRLNENENGEKNQKLFKVAPNSNYGVQFCCVLMIASQGCVLF